MEEYSDRRSKPGNAFLYRGSRFSSRNCPGERTNQNSDALGSSRRLYPRMAGNQERPRYLYDSFKPSSSRMEPASSSKFPLRKFEEKRRQSLSAGVDIAESSRRKVEVKQLEGSKKIVLDDENSDALQSELESFTTQQGHLLSPGPEGSHFAGRSGVSAHKVRSLVRSASLSSRTHRQKDKEVDWGTPGASFSSFSHPSTVPGSSTVGVRSSYGHTSGVQRPGLKNFGYTSVPDVQQGSSDSVRSRRFEVMRKRASDLESSSRSRSLSGPSSLGHSPPTDICDTGPRTRMSEPLPQQIIRRSSRNHQEQAFSVRTRRPSPQATRLRLPDERADDMLSLHESSTRNGQSDQETISFEEVATESSLRPFYVELPHDIYSSSRRRSSDPRNERDRQNSHFEESPPQMFPGLLVERDSHRHIPMGGITEVLVALERIEQQAELSYEQYLLLESNLFLGALASHDRHRDMRMDIDNMSYEELLALEERIGSVSTALSEEQFAKCLKRSIYCPVVRRVRETAVDDMKCSICQEEYAAGEEVGRLPCEHRYHVCCIHQWLRQKNWCPVCKASAVPSTG